MSSELPERITVYSTDEDAADLSWNPAVDGDKPRTYTLERRPSVLPNKAAIEAKLKEAEGYGHGYCGTVRLTETVRMLLEMVTAHIASYSDDYNHATRLRVEMGDRLAALENAGPERGTASALNGSAWAAVYRLVDERLAALEKASPEPRGDAPQDGRGSGRQDTPASPGAALAPDFAAMAQEFWEARATTSGITLADWLRANAHRLQAPAPVAPVRDEEWWRKVAILSLERRRPIDRQEAIREEVEWLRRTFEPIMQASAPLDVEEIVQATNDHKYMDAGGWAEALRTVLRERGGR